MFADDYKPRSTTTHLEEFLKSTVWLDMADMLFGWREMARAKLEGVTDMLELGRLQGEAKCYADLSTLPYAMLEQLKVSEKEQANAKSERSFNRTRV